MPSICIPWVCVCVFIIEVSTQCIEMRHTELSRHTIHKLIFNLCCVCLSVAFVWLNCGSEDVILIDPTRINRWHAIKEKQTTNNNKKFRSTDLSAACVRWWWWWRCFDWYIISVTLSVETVRKSFWFALICPNWFFHSWQNSIKRMKDDLCCSDPVSHNLMYISCMDCVFDRVVEYDILRHLHDITIGLWCNTRVWHDMWSTERNAEKKKGWRERECVEKELYWTFSSNCSMKKTRKIVSNSVHAKW